LSRWWYLLLLCVVAGTQVARAAPEETRQVHQELVTATPTSISVPTVTVFRAAPVFVPTVVIPKPTATPAPTHVTKKKTVKRKPVRRAVVRPRLTWILAYLTSYCPGSAGWLSSSGYTVFYGMLANNYYRFGTRVYIPVIGMTGVVLDHVGDDTWNHFDVWSAVCYSTPTGYFKVGIAG
jgi:hypothetical protein